MYGLEVGRFILEAAKCILIYKRIHNCTSIVLWETDSCMCSLFISSMDAFFLYVSPVLI